MRKWPRKIPEFRSNSGGADRAAAPLGARHQLSGVELSERYDTGTMDSGWMRGAKAPRVVLGPAAGQRPVDTAATIHRRSS